MKPISATKIKSLHVGKIEFMIQTPPGAWGHKMEETDGRSVLAVSANFILRTTGYTFNHDMLSITSKEILDTAEKLSSLVEDHLAEVLGSTTAVNEIPEGIGRRGI